MGISTSHQSPSCGAVCHCFLSDSNVTHVYVHRKVKVQWQWTSMHQSALVNTTPIPQDIAFLIKDFSYSQLHKCSVTKSLRFCETYYKKLNELLHKNICLSWVMSHHASSCSIAIFGKDSAQRQSVLNTFNNNLPSLTKKDRHERTIFVNKCQIRLQLIDASQSQKRSVESSYPPMADISLVLVTDNDEYDNINNTLTDIWNVNESMKNCILVQLKPSERKLAKYFLHTRKTEKNCTFLLARKWNIAHTTVCHDDRKRVNKLFEFALKYYWFCTAQLLNDNKH